MITIDDERFDISEGYIYDYEDNTCFFHSVSRVEDVRSQHVCYRVESNRHWPCCGEGIMANALDIMRGEYSPLLLLPPTLCI